MIDVGSGSYTTDHKEVKVVSLGGPISVAAGESSYFLTVTPPAGERWNALFLRIAIPPPVGGGSGTHSFMLYLSDGGVEIPILYARSVYGSEIHLNYGGYFKADSYKSPDTDAALAFALSRLFSTNSAPIKFRYLNNTDVNQTGTCLLYLAYQISKF